MGEGLVRNTAKISASAVSAFSPPESSVSTCGFLPGGRQRISRPLSSGSSLSMSCSSASPPWNRILNSRSKCARTTFEGVNQALAALLVEVRDAGAQLRDGLSQFVALLLHVLELAADLGQLFLRAQVHAAEPLALGLQLHNLLLDVLRGGQIACVLDASGFQHILGLALEILADEMRIFAAALAGGFEPGFHARPRLARRR